MAKKKCSKSVPVGDGNTKTSPTSSKHLSFTLNNWSDKDLNKILFYFNKRSSLYVIGKEVGEEKETPHLQGAVSFPTKTRFSTLKRLNDRIHWERTRNIDASFEYCKKEGNYISNMEEELGDYINPVWRPWQLEVLKILETEPNSRTVNWFYETTGNVGKSFIAKHLVEIHNALLVSGKAGDIFHQIGKRMEAKIAVKLVIIDIPRCAMNHISYKAIEEIKNGLIMSGKYEGGQYTFKAPHVIVFSNEYPDYLKFSIDRWNIYDIDEGRFRNPVKGIILNSESEISD